jgi:hypothetical protein
MVAQVSSNLLYRGFPIRWRLDLRTVCRLEAGDTADWKSPVSHVFNLPVARQIGRARWWLRSADCKLAIQQSATLRYFGCGCAALWNPCLRLFRSPRANPVSLFPPKIRPSRITRDGAF